INQSSRNAADNCALRSAGRRLCSSLEPSKSSPVRIHMYAAAQFGVNIDNSFTTTTCTANGADPKDRCNGCCQARALAGGLTHYCCLRISVNEWTRLHLLYQ
ncbi:hypothetical protein OSTOST_08798, partial [Ostertagia ostertagi]